MQGCLLWQCNNVPEDLLQFQAPVVMHLRSDSLGSNGLAGLLLQAALIERYVKSGNSTLIHSM